MLRKVIDTKEISMQAGFGDTASVGIGGLTLGGGVGYLVSKHGLTIDNLLAAELVTADGQLLRVDDQTHPDLFWAIRGGGGNFGVATRFRFRLHPLDTKHAPVPPTLAGPGNGWSRSSAATTPPTCSGSTRTSRRRSNPLDHDDSRPPR
jgi:hypothetical protein